MRLLPHALLALSALAAPVHAQEVVVSHEPEQTAQESEQTLPDPAPVPAVKPLWLVAEVGLSSMDMGAFAFAYGGFGTSLVPRRDEGVALQVAAGGRYRFFTFGARAGHTRYPGYPINVVGGELGVQWPVRWVEPHVQLHAGYAWHGPADLDLEDPGLSGPAFGGGVGLRMPLGDFFVVGISFDMDLMWLTGKIRLADEGPGVDPAYNASYRRAIALGLAADSYSAQGYQLRSMLTLGLRAW